MNYYFILFSLIFLILAIHFITYYLYSCSKENFSNLEDSTLLLSDTYDVNHTIELNNQNTNKLAKDVSYTNMSSFKQTTNNKKNWNKPDNGSCINSDFCNNIYKEKIFNIKPFTKANLEDNNRVNIYIAEN